MKNFFEIRSQTGFSRQGRINWKTQVISTPNILLPTNSVFNKYYDHIPSLSISKEKFPGYIIEDPLNLVPNLTISSTSKLAIESILTSKKSSFDCSKYSK